MSGHSSSGSQSPAVSCVENPPPRSSATGEREGTSATIESVQPSAPAWAEEKKACHKMQREKGRNGPVEVYFNSYLAYVGVMTKMVGNEDLDACFWGPLVDSDFFICSWRRFSSPRSQDMVRSLGRSCSVQSQRCPADTAMTHSNVTLALLRLFQIQPVQQQQQQQQLTELHQCIDEAQEGDHEVEYKHRLQLQLHLCCHGVLTS